MLLWWYWLAHYKQWPRFRWMPWICVSTAIYHLDLPRDNGVASQWETKTKLPPTKMETKDPLDQRVVYSYITLNSWTWSNLPGILTGWDPGDWSRGSWRYTSQKMRHGLPSHGMCTKRLWLCTTNIPTLAWGWAWKEPCSWTPNSRTWYRFDTCSATYLTSAFAFALQSDSMLQHWPF